MIDPNPPRNPGAGPDADPKEFRLGVLLIHGIGTQPPRDTLVRWGDVLIKLIGQATRNEVIATVGRGTPGDRSGDKPAEAAVHLRVRAGGQEEKWLLTECWWADCFPAPTYSELVSWSVRAMPGAIALYIAERYWRANEQASGDAKVIVIAVAKAVIQLLVAMALAPVFIALLALTLLLGLLPIPQLRALILSTQSTLAGTVGDSLAFVESPLRAALIRTRILEGLERLQERCERTVIVAHSQGAAAVLDALHGIMEVPDQEAAISQPPPKGPVPDTLVTFGSGINQLVSLRFLSTGRPEKTSERPEKTSKQPEKTSEMNPAYVAMVTLLVMIGTPLYLYVSIRFGSTTVWQLGEAAALWTAVLVSIVLLAWLAGPLIDNLKTPGATTWEKAGAWIMLAVMLLAVGAASIYAIIRDLPLLPVIILSMALIFLVFSLVMILKAAVKASVRKPPGLSRWVDLYASADPVPNGRTRIAYAKSAEPKSAAAECVRVWNRGSFLSDHTTYWDNLDGFVLRIAQVCAETAKSAWQDKLPPATCWKWVDIRAAWRVDFLRYAVRLNALLWLLAFFPLWTRYEACLPLLFETPSWFPAWATTAARAAVLLVLVAVGWWATAALIRWPWSLWVRMEQEEVLTTHKFPTANPVMPLIGMGTIISLLAILVSALALGKPSIVLVDPNSWFPYLFMLPVGGGVIFALIALSLRPERQRPATPATHSGKGE